jgi:hypothetical protein
MVEDSVGQEVSDLAKCTRQPALSVVPSARFPSRRPKADLFTAGTAGKNAEDSEGAHKFVLLTWGF